MTGMAERIQPKELHLINPTPIEETFAVELATRDIPFIHQYPVGKYILDFAIESSGIKIDAECDGDQFHKKTRQQDIRDRVRDQFLMKRGWLPIRISGWHITKNVSYCVDKIQELLRGKG